MSDRLLFKTRHAPTLEAVRALRHQLSPLLNSYCPNSGVQQRIELVVTEAFTNLVKHASAQPCFVELRVRIDDQWIWIDLVDDGGRWNPIKQPTSALGEFELKEHGLGVALMLSQSDRQRYTREGLLNRLSLGWDRQRRSRILLVDDDATQRRLLSAYLRDQFDVIEAASGKEALELLGRERISLVLSDIQMPDIDGFELRAQLDQIPACSITPFVLLTGQDSDSHIAQATALGVDDYLTKPIDKSRLIHTLCRVLERRRQVSSRLQERLDGEITATLAWKAPADQLHWRFASFSKNTGLGGGDFIIHQQSGKRMTLALADTMGHDEGAKFFSHAFAGYLRGFISAGSENQPAGVLLERLSQAAWEDQLFSRTTLSCCTLVLMPNGELEIACGGHPPPLIVDRSGSEAIEVSGVLPGLVAAADYQSATIKLGPGERLVLYTDGLFDSAPCLESRSKLEADIVQTLQRSADLPIQQALDLVEQLFDQTAGLLPRDDASLLLIETVERAEPD